MLRLKLTIGQRGLLGDKLADIANVAAGALIFGQSLSERPFSVRLTVTGVLVWAVVMVAALISAPEVER